MSKKNLKSLKFEKFDKASNEINLCCSGMKEFNPVFTEMNLQFTKISLWFTNFKKNSKINFQSLNSH